MIADVTQDIADEVRLFSKNYDIVLTSGGLGPTHDDVTMAGMFWHCHNDWDIPLLGIATAFNEELCYSTRCAKLLGISGPDDPNPLVKMAMVNHYCYKWAHMIHYKHHIHILIYLLKIRLELYRSEFSKCILFTNANTDSRSDTSSFAKICMHIKVLNKHSFLGTEFLNKSSKNLFYTVNFLVNHIWCSYKNAIQIKFV